jgi:hypothetical protein
MVKPNKACDHPFLVEWASNKRTCEPEPWFSIFFQKVQIKAKKYLSSRKIIALLPEI